MYLKVDSREKDEEILDLLSDQIDYEVCPLVVGDYLWCNDSGGIVCIEHKAVNDFRASMMNGHLDTQIADIKQYPRFGLFITGDWRTVFDKRYPSFNRSIVKNKILSIEIFHGVPVSEFKHPNDFVDAIVSIGRIFDNHLDGVTEVTRNTYTKNKLSPNYQMYSAIEGLGRKKIIEIMKLYPCIFDFIEAYRSGERMPKNLVNKTTEKFLERVECEGKEVIRS